MITGPKLFKNFSSSDSGDYAAVCQQDVCVCVSYRHFRHPDWFGLLVADLVFQTLVPSVGAGLHVDARWKGKHQRSVKNEKHCLERVFFFFFFK